MSKELEAFNRIWEDCSKLDLDYVSKHNLMDDLREIKQALEQAQKQEKLLKLYKELATVRGDMLYCYEVVDFIAYNAMEKKETQLEKEITEEDARLRVKEYIYNGKEK